MHQTDNRIMTDHKNRINKVFKFIDDNLDSDLSLDTISRVALYSPYHFHRVFKYVTGETLKDYVSRKKIERSALDLLHKDMSATEIAHKYGFSDNSSFSRAFKKYFGMSPRTFKKQNPYKHSKIRQLHSKNGQEYPDFDKYICIINNLKQWIKMNANIEIKNIEKTDLASVSVIGIQNIENAYEKIMQWATPRGLMNDQTKMVTVYHDSFKVTEPNKIRMSASIILNEPAQAEGEIGLTSIEAGKFIVGGFEINMNEFEKSWTGMFVWMNENGYKKADRDPLTIYHNNYKEHPELKFIVDLCIPIQ